MKKESCVATASFVSSWVSKAISMIQISNQFIIVVFQKLLDDPIIYRLTLNPSLNKTEIHFALS